MTTNNFIKLVVEMRQAQKNYFATRSRFNLDIAKKKEKEVDIAIKEIRDTQLSLF